MIWLRVGYPRLREDQLQRLAWQVLVPLALLQLALTGVVRVRERSEPIGRTPGLPGAGQGLAVTLRTMTQPRRSPRSTPTCSPSCRRAAAA